MAIGFREALFLLPIATSLHVLDEWPGFPHWARRFASPLYSDREYIRVHALALAISISTPLLFSVFPGHVSAYLILTLVIGPAQLCNALFHIGASVVTPTPCPGVLSSMVVYLPMSCLLLGLALSEGIVSVFGLCVALATAAIWHAIEVGHNVWKLW